MKKGHASKESWDRQLADMTNSALLRILENHREPNFWDRPFTGPVTKQYVRNWASYARREARTRGLIK